MHHNAQLLQPLTLQKAESSHPFEWLVPIQPWLQENGEFFGKTLIFNGFSSISSKVQ
tara:strand:- start:53 stop:223 length:171 start_codon:yes stop_codon:yes gene_type:complete